MKEIILGVLLFIGSMFGGAYLLHELGYYHWAIFPVLVTFACGWLAGIWLFAIGVVGMDMKG